MSPMSPRLLRPRQTTHPEAADWASRVVANGGSVSGTTLRAVSQFCRDIDKTAGLRGCFYRLSLLCGTSSANLEAVRTPLYRGPSLSGTQYGGNTDTSVSFVQNDYNETGTSGGLVGNGSSKYLNTGFATNTLSDGNRHIAAYEIAKATGTFQESIGSEGASSNTQQFLLGTFYAADVYRFCYASDTSASLSLSYSGGAFWCGVNNASGSGIIYKNGTSVASNSGFSAASPTSRNLFVFALNRNNAATDISSVRLGAYSIGLSMTAAQASAYYNAMQTFQAALARNV